MAHYTIKSYILTRAGKPTLVVCPIFLVFCHIAYVHKQNLGDPPVVGSRIIGYDFLRVWGDV